MATLSQQRGRQTEENFLRQQFLDTDNTATSHNNIWWWGENDVNSKESMTKQQIMITF